VRIAVVGAGLAGLGVTYFLIQKGFSVTLFDENGIGFGASKIPIGLCHPYVGRSGKPSKFASEALLLTNELIESAEKTTGKKLADRNGILRLEWTPSEWYPDLKKMTEGVLICSGMTVFLEEYVHALYASMKNVNLVKKKILSEGELEEFDKIIFAMGFGMKQFDLPVNYVKGQVLIGSTNQVLERTVMKARGHLSPLDGKRVQLGSTYEHHFLSDEPDREVAERDLAAKMGAFFQSPGEFVIDDCRAGVRVCVKEGYLPIVQKWSEKAFIFTGLGSRGLLYHAYYGRHLANLIG
jgi:glycine/D-amino acid oxidase-like deaminating enzyme